MEIKIDKSIRGLIFDIDGTLADTMPVHFKAWTEVSHKLGFTYPESLFYDLAGVPTPKIVLILNERLGLNLDVDSTVSQKEKAFLKNIGMIKPIEPVIEVARKYKGILPMSCGTGGLRHMASLTLKTVGLENFFDIIVTADDVEKHKPDPETFTQCAKLMKVSSGDCLVFEDGEMGFEAAKRAGMKFIDIRPYA
jgi:beta-phosphoglucomutase-like phosphatase (HAD superfamily)